MPIQYQTEVNKSCTHTDDYETWLKRIFTVLESSRSANVSALTSGFGVAKSANDGNPNSSPSKAHTLTFDGHNCSKSQQCKEKWDYLGCIHLYKVTKAEERIKFMKDRKACWFCGYAPFFVKNKKHVCSWRGNKEEARCTFTERGYRCRRAM